MSGYQVMSLDDLERFTSSDGSMTLLPLRRTLGFRPFGVNAWLGARAGDRVIEEHSEPDGTEELYVVVRGRATFTLGAEALDAPAGTLVHAPPGTFRGAVAAEDDTLVLAVGAKEGETFKPSGWEDFYVANALRRAGEVERGREIIKQPLANHPLAWHGPYNAACYEALAGDADAAFAHLRHARGLDADAVRRIALRDDDLDAIRDDPRFAQVIA